MAQARSGSVLIVLYSLFTKVAEKVDHVTYQKSVIQMGLPS